MYMSISAAAATDVMLHDGAGAAAAFLGSQGKLMRHLCERLHNVGATMGDGGLRRQEMRDVIAHIVHRVLPSVQRDCARHKADHANTNLFASIGGDTLAVEAPRAVSATTTSSQATPTMR